ncbi:MAG: hypothetical protein NTY77_05975 [Elusimicrobia bacterium]|nr:hypothetical protein [Elusimicrobiota bacterium]
MAGGLRSRAGCLLLVALAVMPVCSEDAPGRPAETRQAGLARLAVWVARCGKDREVDKSAALTIGLRTKSAVPMRTVELGAAESPDGRSRALSLVYNSDGKTMKPVAFVLWRIDVSSSLPAGTYTEGRTFLAKLNGRLVRAVAVTQEPRRDGEPLHTTVPIPFDSPASAHGLHKEFEFWLAESAKSR